MNLGRSYSRSRSKSRSPVPPSPQPSSSPRFLPPSHYAAAAGIPYPPPSRAKDDDARSKTRAPLETREHAPPSDVPSESSFEYKPRTESRFSLFARRMSVSSSRPTDHDTQGADVPDLPMLEAQLLPTLRDTITRMTRPPNSPSSAPPSPMLDPPRDRRRSLSPALVSSSPRPQDPPLPPAEPREPVASRNSSSRRHAVVSGAPPLKSPRPEELYDPPLPDSSQKPRSSESRSSHAPEKPSQRRRHHTTEATTHSSRHPDARSTPTPTPLDARDSGRSEVPEAPRERKPSKTALKSALRSPTPKSPRPANVAWNTNPSTPKPSRATGSRTPTAGSSSTQTPSKASNAFGASPGLSQIPRPNRSRPGKFSDDSDVEYRWRADNIDRRKLVITNPSVSASSSESEREPSSTRRAQASPKGNRFYQTLPARSSKLSDKTAQVLKRMSQAQNTASRPRQAYFSDADDESALEAGAGHGPSDSVTSTESEGPPPRAVGGGDRIRRQSALVDLMGTTRVSGQGAAGAREHSKYEGESAARAMDGMSTEASSEEESEYSEYEDEAPSTPMPGQHHTPVISQHQSSGTVPTFTFSDDDGTRADQHASSSRQEHSDAQLRDLDAVALARQARAAAVRERMALGIPPSPSDEAPGRHMRTDSEASAFSSIDSMQWQDDASDLSSGAEAMLRKLSGGGRSRETWRRGMQGARERQAQEEEARLSYRQKSRQEYSEPESGEESTATTGGIDRPVSQFFEIATKERVRFAEEDTTITPTARPAPPAPPANPEQLRATLVRDFIAAEEVFVARTRVFVEHFILPLRLQKTRRWVRGVPPRAARLLDWFEDIANLHAQVLGALRADGRPAPSLVPMRAFLPRLELYQPYIVTFVAVAGEVRRDESDFGEFVGLQEEQKECAGWDLERFLAEPVNRLAAYPGSFRVCVWPFVQRVLWSRA
ncbi:hypothetical protein HDZ31DRAFT_43887 [Schizophyllum fasciatum]